MWNVTVRTLGLQGVSEGRRRRVFLLSPCDGGGFSEVPFLPGMGEARAVGSHLTESPDEVSDFFIVPASPWMGQFNRKRKVFPKPQLGGDGGRRRWGFSPSSPWKIRLQSITEAVKGHREHDQDPRLMERGMRVLGSPAALASSQAGLAISVSMCGDAGVVVTLEMLESQVGWGDKSQPHPWAQDLCHPGPLETGLAVLIAPAPHGTGRLMGTDPETMQALFTSSGPGRWHTLSRMARAWGLAAYGPG